MVTFWLHLTLRLLTVIGAASLIAWLVAPVLPSAQVVPVVTYLSQNILLVDVQRHLVASRHVIPGTVVDASVSPDQRQIAFSMMNDRRMDVYVGDLYGRHVRRITGQITGGQSPAWSPDSRQLAFVGMEADNKRGIYVTATDDAAPVETVIKAGNFATPTWSPDGQRLAFAITRFRDLPDLFALPSDCRLRCDRQVLQLTNALVADTAPVWSPDGSTILFLSNRTGAFQLYTLEAACMQPGEVKCVLQTPKQIRLGRLFAPVNIVWALDGHEVYFRAWDEVTNQPGLYAVKGNCPDLPEGCQPRLIFNLSKKLGERITT